MSNPCRTRLESWNRRRCRLYDSLKKRDTIASNTPPAWRLQHEHVRYVLLNCNQLRYILKKQTFIETVAVCEAELARVAPLATLASREALVHFRCDSFVEESCEQVRVAHARHAVGVRHDPARKRALSMKDCRVHDVH